MKISQKVLELLRNVPRGRVTTYGFLARKAHTSPRAVGQIMRNNKHPELYPCYKVISSSGNIHGYAGCLTGNNQKKKIELLKKDGIIIKNGKIDLEKYLYRFSA